jgi:N-acetylneuraminate synthase
MLFDRNIASYTMKFDATLREALNMLNTLKNDVVFLIDEHGVLQGAFTDGDFRRAVLADGMVDIGRPIHHFATTNCFYMLEDDNPREIAENITNRHRLIPLLNSRKQLIAVAKKKSNHIDIGGYSISPESPVFIIAEIGNNHNGSLENAKRLVDAAVNAGANCVKFQMRDLKTLYIQREGGIGYSEDLGTQYVLDLLTRFQLNDEDFAEIFKYCKAKGIIALCTPFDKASVDKLEKTGVAAYKVASADLTNHDLVAYILGTRKPIFLSTGMSLEQEILDIVNLLREHGALYVLLHCNSTYPAPFKDINLRYMDRLAEIGECMVGYSGHDRGVNIAIAAVARGARVIEKHFTLDRTQEGNDHKVSLLPEEFKKMVESIRQVEDSLAGGLYRKISQGELINRETLAKSVVAKQMIRKGEIITEDMLDVRSPGRGLPPYKKSELIGRAAIRNYSPGDFFYHSDLTGILTVPTQYFFDNPFGIPIRYHDVEKFGKMSNLNLLEFHLSYKDMELDLTDFNFHDEEKEVAVHAPELFSSDHVLDLCTEDETYRSRSIFELKRVIETAKVLRERFPKTKRPLIIVNVGGFSNDSFITESALKRRKYEILEDSLAKINAIDVEIIPQTMPPFPWHFGGQQHHNVFVSAEDIVTFCKRNKMRICMDVSHTALACTYFGWDLYKYLEQVAPYTAHYHIADARGNSGEGLQIGEGEINFEKVFTIMKSLSPHASWIPEIWQGHKNDGEGFWLAFERLTSILKLSLKK